MSDLILFWHRRDLRVSDSIGLAQACNTNARVIGVFCFDRSILSNDNVAPARVTYLVGCLKSLAADYRQAESQLLFVEGDPVDKIPLLATTLKAKAVYWHLDIEPYSQTRDERVAAALKTQGIEARTNWDQLLHAPTEITTGNKQPYTVYTPYWRNWSSRSKPAPVEVKLPPSQLDAAELATLERVPTIDLLTAKDLGFTWDNPLKLEPGTSAAARELAEFCRRSICEYDEQRNYPAIAGTSGISAAMKFGVIGIRTVWAATIEAMAETRSDEARAGITTWQQELAWREFYQQAMYHFPSLAQGAYRDALKHFPWRDDQDRFDAWCRGETGYPIVDAAMRQLNEIGWMHNRCRMIVASFLTKDLIINWQWGEKYFMQRLIDGDLSANNGGWQWSASSGMDPKPLRIFNPYTQAQKFDPDADYIRQWVPELKSVDTNLILSGNIPPLTRHQIGYPLPIVDHSVHNSGYLKIYMPASKV